jgi:hypothetical protein
MITCTNAQLLPLKSIKVSPVAALGNEFRFVAGLAESGESDFDKTLDVALSMEGAMFNFVFDYPMNGHARPLFAGCALNRADWLGNQMQFPRR